MKFPVLRKILDEFQPLAKSKEFAEYMNSVLSTMTDTQINDLASEVSSYEDYYLGWSISECIKRHHVQKSIR